MACAHNVSLSLQDEIREVDPEFDTTVIHETNSAVQSLLDDSIMNATDGEQA